MKRSEKLSCTDCWWNCLSFSPATTLADIESLINCIKPNKAIDPNSIPTKILKEFKTEISEPLNDLIKCHVYFNKRNISWFLKVADVICYSYT